MKKLFVFLLLFFVSNNIFSQNQKPTGGGEYFTEKVSNCIAQVQRDEINKQVKVNISNLEKKGIINKSHLRNNLIVGFDWPLRKAGGLTFNSYFSINNFVDQDPGPGLLDYFCGERTYDGHRGIDIDTWPFPWYLYNNNFVEVIAAEAGTIVYKTDGNDDNHCSCSGVWNGIIIQHSDGSRAWYGHMKKNSLNAKVNGQAVSKGEYLGVVASSGCSTGPHLHFEVDEGDGTTLRDPFAGPCNSLNTNSWWASQPANRVPTINAILTHDNVPSHGCPGVSEVPNMANIFVHGQNIFFASYFRDEVAGYSGNFIIRRPDNTIWASWPFTSPNTYTRSWWYWIFTIPASEPFGTWKFEATYNGQTLQHQFQIAGALPVELTSFNAKENDTNSIILNWETNSETNNLGFELERSITGNNWEKVTYVEGSGNSQEKKLYSVIDASPTYGINYYRLKQIDFNGNNKYSKVIAVKFNNSNIKVSVFPNPSSKFIRIQIDKPLTNICKIKITDILGKTVWESEITKAEAGWTKEIELKGIGAYYVSTLIENKIYCEKVIVTD